MATRQKIAGSESGSRHGGGLRTLFDLFRTQKQASRHLDEEEPSTAAVAQEPKGLKKTSGRRLGRHEKNGGARHSALAPDAAAAANESSATGRLFTRLLRRHTKSKRSDHPHTQQQQQDEPTRDNTLGTQMLHGTSRLSTQNKRQSTASAPIPRDYTPIDAKINLGEPKRHSQVYVPTYAAADFARLPIPGSLKDRYSSLIDEQEARKLSQVLSPPIELEDSGNISVVSEDSYRDEHRRLTAATLEGSSHVGSEASFANDVGLINTLQPPPTTSRRQHNRHSYAPSQDPAHRQILEEPEESGEPAAEESSDYQAFLQKALEKDRLETAQMWRAVSLSRPARTSVTPMQPDSTNPHSLQRSGTFGGSKKGTSGSRKPDNAWKRASHLSHQSRDNRARHSYIAGTLNEDMGGDATRKDTKEWNGPLRRLSAYYKPPRNGIPKQTEDKQLTQITLR